MATASWFETHGIAVLLTMRVRQARPCPAPHYESIEPHPEGPEPRPEEPRACAASRRTRPAAGHNARRSLLCATTLEKAIPAALGGPPHDVGWLAKSRRRRACAACSEGRHHERPPDRHRRGRQPDHQAAAAGKEER